MRNKNTRLFTRKFLIVQVVTLSRIPITICFAAVLLLFEWSYIAFSTCIILLALAELSDFFDGRLARRFSVVDELGATLDPYSDSISRIIVYWAMACAGLVLALVPLSMAVRDITVAYCRIIMTKHGLSVSSKWSGKIKAGFQGYGSFVMIFGPYYWPWTGEWTIAAASWIIIAVTLWSIIEYIKPAILYSLKSNIKDRKG